MRDIVHADGRGCFQISEEDHDVVDDEEQTYVGCFRDPKLATIEMVCEDSREYAFICADEDDGERLKEFDEQS